MKSSNISFYFVLYIVAIVTVFVITMERDQLLKQRDDDIAHLIEVYVKPLRLSSYADTARFFVDPNHPEIREPIRIRTKVDGPVDKNDVSFSIIDVQRHGGNGGAQDEPRRGEIVNEGGDGVLTYPPLDEGVYAFKVTAYKKRIVPAGDKMRVTIKDTTYVVPYSARLEKVDRDTTVLIAKVEKSGVIAPQLTLSVQDPKDNWVIGVPLRKKVFVSGVEEVGRVSFSAGPLASIERGTAGSSFVTLVWEKPTLGPHSFTVSGNANRGLGEKDRASTSFVVDVDPATFSNTPPAKGFWGIPYVFDGQIVGVNPLDLSFESAHDGRVIGSKPVIPKDTLVPDRNWNSLSYKVVYHGTVIKEHRVSLSAPPPPQIKWVQQNLDRSRNMFLISATSSDPIGGAVRMSLQAQPPGIAQLDKIKGTNFTITINLENRPPAVFLKLTATDQYGGQSTSAKQFNVPQ